MIKELVQRSGVEITHIKVKNFAAKNVLATTPISVMKKIELSDIEIPELFVSDKDIEIIVKKVKSVVGSVNRSSVCKVCGTAVLQNAIRKRSYTCGKCNETFPIEELVSSSNITLKVESIDSDIHEVTVAEEIISPLLPPGESDFWAFLIYLSILYVYYRIQFILPMTVMIVSFTYFLGII